MIPTTGTWRAFAAGVLLAAGLWGDLPAQESIVERNDVDLGHLEDSPLGFRNGSLIVAPIPFSNPMIGSGLVLGAGYLFQLDEGSDPSIIGLGGLRSDNGSQAGAAAVSVNFDSNRWKLSLGGGRADVKYDLYTGVAVIPLRQEGTLARMQLAYGFTPQVNLGLVARYLDTTVTTQSPLFPGLPPQFQPSADAAILNAGLIGNWDTRDDTVYPTGGFHLKVSGQRGFILDGIGQDYSKAYFLFDNYLKVTNSTILASRVAMCGASTTAPFFDACSVGGVDAMRGFNATQILDDRSMSAQLELRQRIGTRIGLVAFAGIGGAGPAFDQLTATGKAGGIGLRYRVSKKFPVDFAIDASINDLDEKLLYISVGQRF